VYNDSMTPDQVELTKYLTDVLHQLRILQATASRRNKTKKFKAISSILTIVKGRADATYQYVKAGGHADFSVIIQQQMYDPIIKWLEAEIG
jgi:hypothetical protein